MFTNNPYNNNKTRVSLREIIDEPRAHPVKNMLYQRNSQPEIPLSFEKQISENHKQESVRRQLFMDRYSRANTPYQTKSTERINLIEGVKQASLEEIMQKVSKIRDQIGFKRRTLSHQRFANTHSKPIPIVECQNRQVFQSQQINKEQTDFRKTRASTMFRSTTANINVRQQSAGARVVQNPQSITDRTVNFLIKEIDKKGSSKEKVEVACKVYKDIKGEIGDTLQKKMNRLFKPRKSPTLKVQEQFKQTCKGSSIIVKQFRPMGNIMHQSKDSYNDPLQHKYETPFNEQTQRKQRFLKKGSNITGMILQQLYKGNNKNEIDLINFQKEKFVKEFNQTVPEQLQTRWKNDIQRSLKILKGKCPKRSPSQPIKYQGFDVEEVIYLSDNKKLFFERNLNDYYDNSGNESPGTQAHISSGI